MALFRSALLLLLHALLPDATAKKEICIVGDEGSYSLLQHSFHKDVRRSSEDKQAPYVRLDGHANRSCDVEVGLGRLARYAQVGKGAGQELCQGGNGASAFSCKGAWTEWSSSAAKAEDYACRGRNLSLTVQEGQPISLHAPSCSWTLPSRGLELQFFIFGGKPVPVELSSEAQACDEDIGPGNTLLLYSEADFWNPFISQAQAIMAYTTLRAMSINPQRVRVLFTGQVDKHLPMVSLIAGAFSQGGEAMHAGPQPRTVCAQDVVLPAGGANSWIRRNAGKEDPWARQCHDAPLLRGYAAFLMSAFSVVPAPPAAGGSKHRVTVLLREPNRVHSTHYKRHMTNPAEVTGSLRLSGIQLDTEVEAGAGKTATATEAEQAAFLGALSQALRREGAVVTEAQPELMSIAEQVALFADTDITISAHSAALANMFLMPKCGQVLEFCTGGDFQFVNYARLAGREHRCMPGLTAGWGTRDFAAPVETVLQMEQEAAERWRQCTKAA